MRMKRFTYWCKNVNTGDNYYFVSKAYLTPGVVVKNEDHEDCIIIDAICEDDTDKSNNYSFNELMRRM